MKILLLSALTDNQENNYPEYYKYSEYMNDLTLHGLRQLFGEEVIDYPGCWYLYKDEVNKRKFNTNLLWGKGFTYKNILDEYDKIDRNDILNKIKQNYFDLIIYGSIRRSNLFFEEVKKSNTKFIFIDGEDDTFIDKKYSKIGKYFKREILNNEQNVLPINFSVPKNKIVNKIDYNPSNILAPLIPGKSKTYIYKTEEDYYQMYQKSIFAITFKKVGWDCMRHYEILMNGCIPLFLDIDKCPENIMTNFPKNKIYNIKKKYEFILNAENPYKIFSKKFQKKTILIDYFKYLFSSKKNIKSLLLDNSEIYQLKEELISFTKKNLTTETNAKNLVERANR